MMKRYLKQAPTVIVIGVTGIAAWPALFPEGAASPSKEATRPPAADQGPASLAEASDRDPFQIARPKPMASTAPGSAAKGAAAAKAEKAAALAQLPAEEDAILGGMRLGGTFVGRREQIAIIDNRIYARGDQLRKADGSLLPYVIAEVRKDRALIRRGRRDFVLGFSDAPRLAAPRADAPALAKAAPTPNPAVAARQEAPPPGKGRSPADRPGGNGGDPASMLLKLLSGLGGSSGGGATSNPLSALTAGASASSTSASGTPVNSTTIQAGLDALMGKYDNIGRSDDTSGATAGGTP